MIENVDIAEHREMGSDLITRAFQLLVAAEQGDRPQTDNELEEILYCLTMAAVKFKHLPGGTEAAKRVYERANAELNRRGEPWFERRDAALREALDGWEKRLVEYTIEVRRDIRDYGDQKRITDLRAEFDL